MKWNIERIYQAFSDMENAGWNISAPLKWRFSFINRNKEKLAVLYQELIDHDYIVDELEFRNNEWRLVVIKTEILAPEKLHRRNMAFEKLARHCDIDCYDGWEVCKI